MNGLSRWLLWVQAHGTALMTAAGALLIALVVIAVCLTARRASLASVLRGIAIPLVLLWEAQGVYGVALRLHAPRELAWAFAGVASAVVLALASFAHEHWKRHKALGPNGRMMWLVAVPMGAVVAANAGSLTGAGLRVLLPLLSLVMFRAPYLPDEPEGQRQKTGSWRLTPRRIGVMLGLLDPADTDLTTVHSERQVRLLTRHAAGFHRGFKSLRRWHGWRFERLALMATDVMIAEAASRVQRVHEGLASTAPVTVAEVIAVAGAEPVAAAVDGDGADSLAAAIAAPAADGSGDTKRDGTGDGSRAPIAEGSATATASAVAKVRRKGAGNAGDDEIRAAVRELRETDPDLNAYKIGKALKGSKGTIGDRRSARLLAEVQAESRVVTPIGSRRSSGE